MQRGWISCAFAQCRQPAGCRARRLPRPRNRAYDRTNDNWEEIGMCRPTLQTRAQNPWLTPYAIRRVVFRLGLGVLALLALAAPPDLLGFAAHAAERPTVAGRNGGVSAGHPLTTAAAFEILARGGNAFDAGVAALLVGGVVEQDSYSLGGEALVLVYPHNTGKVVSVVGQGWAPQGASIDWYAAKGKSLDGKGLNPAVVPGALHAALTVLDQWGTM